MVNYGTRDEYEAMEDEKRRRVTEWDEADDVIYAAARRAYLKLARKEEVGGQFTNDMALAVAKLRLTCNGFVNTRSATALVTNVTILARNKKNP